MGIAEILALIAAATGVVNGLIGVAHTVNDGGELTPDQMATIRAAQSLASDDLKQAIDAALARGGKTE